MSDSDKRKQILKAAVKVFSRKGFHETKVDEIARLADVGKGTVYEYFAGKAELFQEMFKTGMEFYMTDLTGALKPGMSCRAKLVLVARHHMNFVHRYKDLARITMTEHVHFDEGFRNWIWENRMKKEEFLREIISEGIAAGEFRRVDPHAAALAFMGAISVICSPMFFSKGRVSDDDFLEPVMDVIFSGLANSEK